MEEFLQAYIDAAIWSSLDDNNNPLDENYSEDDLSEETLERMKRDCELFIELNKEDIRGRESQAGHDFWLTRNGHGCGFWETDDWEEEKGERLTKSADGFGTVDLFIGDDGKIYCV